MYQFNLSILLKYNVGQSYHRVLFKVNGSADNTWGDTLENQAGTSYSSATIGLAVKLSANDTVRVYNGGSETYGTGDGNFSGYLVG